MPSTRFTFITLIVVVLIAGLSQGLTLPLLAILLEQQGVSSVANGLNAAAMYIGIILVSPWLELPIRRFGYKTTIVLGLLLVTLTTVLLPVFNGLTVWFVLRFLMGIGDTALHYASQLWVSALASPERRGRDISLYGLAYGGGFSIGPLGMNLLPYGNWAPFAAISVVYIIAFAMLAFIKNEFPKPIAKAEKTGNRYAAVMRLAWIAVIPSFLYGYLEASLNGSFPIYGLRIGLSIELVSIILPAFVAGSLILQLPLGSLSDRIGRKKVMMACAVIGCLCFSAFPLASHSVSMMMALLAVAGACVGSFYSLGLAFAADLLPSSIVPTAGVIAGMNFAAASIIAPNINGFLLSYFAPAWMFVLIGILLALFALAGFFFQEREAAAAAATLPKSSGPHC